MVIGGCLLVVAQSLLMPLRRKRVRFEQLTQFEQGRIIGLREAGLSYRAVASRLQRRRSTVMRVWKQWTDECRTTQKSGRGPRNVTSTRDDRHLHGADGPYSFL